MVDPTQGIKYDLLEDRGFAVAQPKPNGVASDSGSDAEIVYFPPVKTGSSDLENRRRAPIGLSFPERTYGHHLPYYYEVTTLQPGLEKLVLYVDRTVEVTLPEKQKQTPDTDTWPDKIRKGGDHGRLGTWYSMTWQPERLSAMRHNVHVYIHRAQLRGSIPQRRVDVPALFHPPVQREAAETYRALFQSNSFLNYFQDGLDFEVEYRAFGAYRPSGDGGARVVLGRIPVATHAVGVPWSTSNKTRPPEVLAELDLSYWDPRFRGAYHIQLDSSGPDVSVLVTLSKNVKATFTVAGSESDNILESLKESAKDQLEGKHVDLNIRNLGPHLDEVPRPDQRTKRKGKAWHDWPKLNLKPRPGPPDPRIIAMDLVVGFIPGVGDIYDVAKVGYALATGEDFAGQNVKDSDLALIGITLLPAVPSSIRVLRGTSDLNRLWTESYEQVKRWHKKGRSQTLEELLKVATEPAGLARKFNTTQALIDALVEYRPALKLLEEDGAQTAEAALLVARAPIACGLLGNGDLSRFAPPSARRR